MGLKFDGKNYSIEVNEDYQFILSDGVNADQVFDSFDELVEANPICEEARSFFFN